MNVIYIPLGRSSGRARFSVRTSQELGALRVTIEQEHKRRPTYRVIDVRYSQEGETLRVSSTDVYGQGLTLREAKARAEVVLSCMSPTGEVNGLTPECTIPGYHV